MANRGFKHVPTMWQWDEEEKDYIIPGGKYAGITIREIINYGDDPYLDWLLSPQNLYLKIPRRVYSHIENLLDEYYERT